MIITRSQRRVEKRQRRSGAALVEAAIVLPVFLLFLFGIFEYSRFIMVRNLADHAVREGAREAVVHTYDKTTAQIVQLVRDRMGGQSAQIKAQVRVFRSNSSGANLGDWTNASFGEWVMVELTGTFRPALPSIFGMGSTIPITAQAMMRSEAN